MKKFALFNKTQKLKSELVLKHGAYNTALIAIIIALVIVVNIIVTAVAQRFPTNIDLSTTGQNTITEENIDYIKDVDKEVNIIVCATEEGYTGGVLAQYASYYYTAQDSSGQYYAQTLKLLKEYEKHNKNIKLTFSDPDAASFSTVQAMVPNTALKYGDILVYCTFKNKAGTEIKNARVVTFTDIYSLSDKNGYAAYGYGSYTVSGSNVETAVTSAIYAVTSEDQKVVGVLSSHGTDGVFDAAASMLKLNNYEVLSISDPILNEIPAKIDLLVLAGPKRDFAASEIATIEKFLANDGKKGKNMVVFCDAKGANMPNLYAFLAEWGAEVEPGNILFETDKNNFLSGKPTAMGFENTKTDYTKPINDDNRLYISDNNIPISAAFTTYGNRETEVLMQTKDSVVSAPVDVTADWAPDNSYTKKQYAAAIYTSDTQYDGTDPLSGGMLVFSSTDFISANWKAYDAVGNESFLLAALNSICGKDATDIYFETKTVANYSFTQPTQAETTLASVIFVVVLPIVLMACGIYVWYRRKNR